MTWKPTRISDDKRLGGKTETLGGKVLTSHDSVAFSDDQNWLMAGTGGSTLLEDCFLREEIFHFDHERIAERSLPASGTGAHGYFECTDAIPDLTSAGLFQTTGARVPVFARFSPVAGSKVSTDTPRDVRGFSVKFSTLQGIWDLVGNNIPVFFRQDAIDGTDQIASIRPDADLSFANAASAPDALWDCLSLRPENLHVMMWAMSDRGLPRSLRMMEGFGVHTFRMVNAEGKASLVKFHWKPELGVQSTTWDEAVKISGADPDYHSRDLFEAIRAGDYPVWDMGIQVFDEEWADAQPYDVRDVTKLVPEEAVPVRIIGRMVLDHMADNFFAETEQVAFLSTNLVPGIEFLTPPLPQAQQSYCENMQQTRLKTRRFPQIVNIPKCLMHNFQRDGRLRTQVPNRHATNGTNSLQVAGGNPGARASTQGFDSVSRLAEPAEEGLRGRAATFADPFSQARMFLASQTRVEQTHIIAALVFELSQIRLPQVRTRILAQLRCVEATMAARVAEGLRLALPTAEASAKAPAKMPTSDALSILKHRAPVAGRSLGLLVSDGADGAMVHALQAAAKAAGASCKIVTSVSGSVTLKDGARLEADNKIDRAPSVLFDAVALVLSDAGAARLAREKAALDFVSDAFAHCKAIGHSAAARGLIDRAGVVPDDFFFKLPGRASDLVAHLSSRTWAREGRVRQSV